MTKVLVSIPEELVDRIDRAARARHLTRSRFLQEAAEQALGWGSPAEMDQAIGRARAALAGAGGFESADLIRRDRDARSARGL